MAGQAQRQANGLEQKGEVTMVERVLRYLGNNALGALALFVVLGGTTYAATGGFVSGGQLRACVNEGGSITLMKAGKKCKHGQKPIAWNQTGPKGAPGAPGATGPAGANGQSIVGPSGEPNTMWARVSASGQLVAGRGAIKAEKPEEYYEVQFDRDVTNCGAVATATNVSPPNEYVGMVELQPKDMVGVYPYNTEKGFANAGFTVVVYC
jgi:hypothetical protein